MVEEESEKSMTSLTFAKKASNIPAMRFCASEKSKYFAQMWHEGKVYKMEDKILQRSISPCFLDLF